MPTSSALDIINGAARLIGAIGQGDTLTGEESQTGLEALNELIDEASTDRLLIYSVDRQIFTLQTAQQVYTCGPGGDFDIPRPLKIEECGVILNNNPAQPLEIPVQILDEKQWAQVGIKNLTGSANFPTAVYVSENYPLQTLTFWPAPAYADIQIALYPWQPLTQFENLTDTFSFPPGYRKAMRYNLAASWAPEFGIEAPPTVQRIANQSRYSIMAINYPALYLQQDLAVQGGRNLYNIYSDSNGVG